MSTEQPKGKKKARKKKFGVLELNRDINPIITSVLLQKLEEIQHLNPAIKPSELVRISLNIGLSIVHRIGITKANELLLIPEKKPEAVFREFEKLIQKGDTK
jgi:hypothetical protein